MKKIGFICLCIFVVSSVNVVANEKDPQAKQEGLDELCEIAREKKLAPKRQKYIKDCIKKEKKEEEYCEQFYSDYGAQSGNRAPLFYDLPACVKAFEFRTKN